MEITQKFKEKLNNKIVEKPTKVKEELERVKKLKVKLKRGFDDREEKNNWERKIYSLRNFTK